MQLIFVINNITHNNAVIKRSVRGLKRIMVRFNDPVLHDDRCGRMRSVHKFGDRWVCFNCNATNIKTLNICTCVRVGDLADTIRTHDDQPIATATHGTLHYFPVEFSQKRDEGVCPRERNYHDCDPGTRSNDCLQLITNRQWLCRNCKPMNTCNVPNCYAHIYDSTPPQNIAAGVCRNHCVFVCVTCMTQHIDKSQKPRQQCRECDTKTNSIVCCGAVHKPHTLTYPCATLVYRQCVAHWKTKTAHYWQLIQDKTIWQLYKTISASPLRRRMSFATALFLHLCWQDGDVDCIVDAGQAHVDTYIRSQRKCAALALIRVRWLPQPLRLMILGYC